MSATETKATDFHRRLFRAIETADDCDAEDCTCRTDPMIKALLAAVWLHAPAEWVRLATGANGPTVVEAPDGTCWSCGGLYPCQNLEAIADEMGMKQ